MVFPLIPSYIFDTMATMKFLLFALFCLSVNTHALEHEPQNKRQPMDLPELELSNYVTIVFTTPESHADALREAMWRAGAGKVGRYSCCSFSLKGISHFIPHLGSNPYIGTIDQMETMVEERIETVCDRAILPHVLEEIKKAHPYEDTVIDIYPIYEAGRKVPK